jgi:hypothetical protein
MASSSETGHAKNIANLKLLNEINAGFGAAYNPSNALYTVAAMVAKHVTCKNLQGDVNTTKGIFEPFQNARVVEFKAAKALARRLRTAAKTCGAGAGFIIDVNKIVTKILGERASKAKGTAADPAGTSASQTSFDNTVDSYDKLAKMLDGEVKYAPNEAELTVAAASGVAAGLDGVNNGVKSSAVGYNNAIIGRDKELYADVTGLCAVGQGSKEYVKQVFGYNSPEYRLVSKIKFKQKSK